MTNPANKIKDRENLWTCGYDTRKVLNLADVVPNIGIDTLANGVTGEQLDALNVPVCKYQTQITIHGTFPELQTPRVLGYKCLVVNQNRSLGVRYVAVDAAKKKLLSEIAKTYGKPWVHIDSRGCQITKAVKDAQEAKGYAAAFPRCFVGSSYFGSAYGRIFFVVELDAIYEKDFWQFANAVWGCNSLETLRTKQADDARKAEQEAAQAKAEYDARQASAKTERSVKLAEIAAQIGGCQLSTLPKSGAFFKYNGAIYRRFEKTGNMVKMSDRCNTLADAKNAPCTVKAKRNTIAWHIEQRTAYYFTA